MMDEIAGPVLKIEKQGDGESAITLLEIENPPIKSPGLRDFRKDVSDTPVLSEQGYLETWNYFPDGRCILFENVRCMSGPMQSL